MELRPEAGRRHGAVACAKDMGAVGEAAIESAHQAQSCIYRTVDSYNVPLPSLLSLLQFGAGKALSENSPSAEIIGTSVLHPLQDNITPVCMGTHSPCSTSVLQLSKTTLAAADGCVSLCCSETSRSSSMAVLLWVLNLIFIGLAYFRPLERIAF
jgi:hypothetical protein